MKTSSAASVAAAAVSLLFGIGNLAAKTPLPLPPAPEQEPAFTAEISLGYDTFYIFRGEELFEQVTWGQVELNYAVSESVSLTLTPWFLSAIDDDFTELDVLPSVTWDAGFVEITAGYAGYIYPRGSLGANEGIDDEHEANLTVAKTFGIVGTSLLSAYNFDRDGIYLEAKIGASIELCQAAALEPSVAVGYSSHYFDADGFTHALISLAMPVKVTGTATITPYIAGNIPLEVLDEAQDAEIFGGVALAVSF